MLLLAAWVLVTRLAVLAAFPGEPDSALFPLGLWRWITAGPLSTRIYDRAFSPGYYWAAAHLAGWTQVRLPGFVPMLNALSLGAAVAAAPLAYTLARSYLPATAAFWSTLLWLLSPAVWWLGIEPHPQMCAIALTLAALAAHRRALKGSAVDLAWRRQRTGLPRPAGGSLEMPRAERASPAGHRSPATERPTGATQTKSGRATIEAPQSSGQPERPQPRMVEPRKNFPWWLLAFAALLGALLVRSDAVFVYGAFFLPWLLTPPQRLGGRGWSANLLPTALLLSGATLGFFIGRGLLLASWRGAPPGEPGTWAQIAGFLGQLAYAHQMLPFLTAAGVAATLFAVAGVFALAPAQRRRWLLILAVWSLPGAAFWLAVRGNNVRHVALLLLPLLWAGAEGWGRLHWRPLRRFSPANRIAVVAALALLLDFVAPAANSNLTLYPSGNVPGSAARLRGKELRFFRLGRRLLNRAAAGTCYLGSYTSPYVLWGSLNAGAGVRLSGELPITVLRLPSDPRPLIFHDVYSAAGYLRAARSCRDPVSLEYTTSGQTLHPLGVSVTRFVPSQWLQTARSLR